MPETFGCIQMLEAHTNRVGVRRFLIGSIGTAAIALCAGLSIGSGDSPPISVPGIERPSTDTSPFFRQGRPRRPPAPMAVASPGLQIVKVLRRVNQSPEGESLPAPWSRDAEASPFAARGSRAGQSALLANRTSLSRLCRLLL